MRNRGGWRRDLWQPARSLATNAEANGGAMSKHFEAYLHKLAETPLDQHTEHTGRAALETLLNHFAARTAGTGTRVQHEPKRIAEKGAPDFKVERSGMILGYVEVKEIGANLDKVLKSPQIAKYRTLSDNIIVTDYLQFVWIDAEGKVRDRQSLAFASDLDGGKIRLNPTKAEAVGTLLSAFFSEAPLGLARSDRLAVALATRSRLLRDYLTEDLVRQEKAHKEGRLYALYDVFREQVFHELTIKEFADAFAQMLAYGLFLAKLNAGEDDVIRLDNVRGYIPGSFRLIRELVRFLEEMQEAEYDDAKWVVEEVLSIVNGLDIEAIRESLSFHQRKAISRKVRAGDEEEHRLFERDPFVYFYEDFLKAYDKETRKSRGVYYTPPPVVNFIVRAVDDILKDIPQVRPTIVSRSAFSATGRVAMTISPLTSAPSSTPATSTTTRPRRFSATSMPCCMRRPIGDAMRNSCASTFRASRFPRARVTSRRCRGSAGRWCRRICCATCRERGSRTITARATMRSSMCAGRPRTSASRLTRPRASLPCPRPCGPSTSAAIR